MSFIEFKEVSKRYYMGEVEIPAVNSVSFAIEKGELTVILGPSGAGKSTVLNLLGGMDTATSGKITVNNREITDLEDKALTNYRAKSVGFVFQFYNLIPSLTVFENVALIREVAENALNTEQILKSVGLWKRRNLFPTQISGGEQQRASIARALCKNPELLLCDEPTGALDSETGVIILELLQKMCRESGHTVVIVTHNGALAEIADRVIRIKNGRLSEVVINTSPKSIREVTW